MATIEVSINDVLGKLHDLAKAETAKIGKSWFGKNMPTFTKDNDPKNGTYLINSGIAEYEGKPSKFIGETSGDLYIRVIKGRWLNTGKDDKIRKMVAKYIELFSGMKNVDPTLDIKTSSGSTIGLHDRANVTYYEVKYKIDLVKVPFTLPDYRVVDGEQDNNKTEPLKQADSSSSSSSSGSSDKRGFNKDTEIVTASNNLSLAEMYREAKLISENAFFESRPFAEKSEKSNLVVEFLK